MLFLCCQIIFSHCKPAKLNNPADPNSKAYFENAVLLCALGVLKACDPCKPAPGPWGTFVGTPNQGQTQGLQMRTDNDYNLYAFNQTSFNFGTGGINFIGLEGTDNNYFLTKFSANGERLWLSYFGRRADTPKGVIVVENDGVYSYLTTQTSTLPNPITAHTNNGNNSLVVKHSLDGRILWTRHYNDGATALSSLVTQILNTEDNSGILVIGTATFPLTNPGQLIGSATGDSWFIQKINYSGDAIWTRYYPFSSPITNYKVPRLAKLTNDNGYAIVALVSADVNVDFAVGLNTYVGGAVLVPMIMKLKSDFSYQWHRYLGGNISAVDDQPPIIVGLPLGRFAAITIFNANVPTIGKPYPGGGNNSSIVYYLTSSGDLLNSSFLVNSGETMFIFDAMALDNGKFTISGSFSETAGFVSELDPNTLTEDYRLIGKEGLRSSTVKHCDGSFSTQGLSVSSIPDAILPFGTSALNTYLSRFKP